MSCYCTLFALEYSLDYKIYPFRCSLMETEMKNFQAQPSKASDLGKRNLILAPNPRDQSFLPRPSVCYLLHLSGVYFAPSIHKPPHKADFSGRLVAQHWRSLRLAWGQLWEWDGAERDSGEMSPREWNIDGREKALPDSPLPVGVARSWWATERKAKTNTLILRKGARRRAMRERGNPIQPFPSAVSLSPSPPTPPSPFGQP